MMLLLWILIALLILTLTAAYCCYWIAFYNPEKRHGDPVYIPGGNDYKVIGPYLKQLCEDLEAKPYERVYTMSFDGLRLSARYYHVADGAPLQIQFHGYRGSGIRDFCGGNMLATKAGFNTLLVDQRAHGSSQGNTMTFGIKERYDCVSWVNFARERFGVDTQILLAGISMGAATVLMASQLELPKNVKGIVADCAYTSPKAIICKVIGDMKLPPKLIYPLVVLGARLFGHFSLEESSAVEAVRHAKVPILLVHGEKDKFVPCAMSVQIYEACASRKKLELYPDAGHGISFALDEPRYEKMLHNFAKSCITGYSSK